MQKWEYLREAIGADDLDARGAEGWELVAVAAGIIFYARPVEDDDETEADPVAALPAVEPAPLPEPEPVAAVPPVEPVPVEPVMEPTS